MTRVVPAYVDLLNLSTMISVIWVDKDSGDSGLKLFSFAQSALTEAEWLRLQGHRDVHVVQRGQRLN